ncbi:VCBS repeat-containing protein [Ohtaekwangia sp.]|uniref:VCBS repeat-containing protein n=1 Tax=Ohtaekwangia sp. TaxID=2066019 RepID=UPI002FDC9954
MMKLRLLPAVLFIAWIVTACNKPAPDTLFRSVPADESGITFNNVVIENDTFNILTHEYIYNGGGVGVADFNKDGLQDLFFAGNTVPNKLYLNKGNFTFNDVTETAGVNEPGRWNSGVAIADVNNDGWMDIYVCATMKPDSADRRNMLFINNGLNKDSVLTFTNQAAAYGVEDGGYSVNAAFFDYDHDKDLDLYVLINQRMDHLPTNYRPKITDGSALNNDKLYRNNGNGTFTDVTKEAGITLEGFGLGLSIADFNLDGWEDIYVSNDYLSNDVLYINNGDGTFQNKIREFIGHQSQFSMGNDAADINNDGLPDLITLDMLPETNDRKKTTISNKSYLNYINTEKYGYEYQYVRNMLHLNNGLNHGIKFSEVGQLSGVYQTEWSWAPLFADFDNDGNKDLIITNGFPKDVTDKDFGNYRADVGNIASPAQLIDSIPVVRIPNYAFKNEGDLTFEDVTDRWGLDVPSFSNGAVFADLDNDGDLDYVINNINDKARVYENTLYSTSKKEQTKASHYLRLKFSEAKDFNYGAGAKVTLHYNHGKVQYLENCVSRGFLSSVENIVHFGLGTTSIVDSVVVAWPDGDTRLFRNVKADQVLSIHYGQGDPYKPHEFISTPLLKAAEHLTGIAFKHQEEDNIDFNQQRTLPHKFSQYGPGIAVGDINQDGLEDFVIGGARNNPIQVWMQRKDGTFQSQPKAISELTKPYEDEGLLLFDADSDRDLDLYVVSGSMEGQKESEYQHRLFINNGKGIFTAGELPIITSSGSCVRASDFDADGDLDLFVGGRVIPASYPMPPASYILRNDKGKFTDVTEAVAPALQHAGMITDALWTDFDLDGKTDLVVAGEFMPVTFFKNQGGTLSKIEASGVENMRGWWNSITAGDFDSDGDIDYIVGNLGVNNNYQITDQYSLKLFAKDFDGNGSVDPVMACYQRETMTGHDRKLYPVHFWDEMNSQSPKFRRKFSRYRKFSKATIDQVLTPEDMKDALVLEANDMHSAYFENKGQGKFETKALPLQVQVAPVNGMIACDINEDGNLDVLMVGNDYGNEVFAGRYDAFTGLVLLGDGKGNFAVRPSAESGFYVPGDAKALVRLAGAKGDVILATQNRDSLKVFTYNRKEAFPIFTPEPLDTRVEFIHVNGAKQSAELYYGAGFLSQSTRKVRIPASVKEIIVYDSQGKTRKIPVPQAL